MAILFTENHTLISILFIFTVLTLLKDAVIVRGNSDFENIIGDALSCYKCAGHDDSSISACMNDPEKFAEQERCPDEVANVTVFPSCHKTKQTAAGKVTSFTRGCLYHYNCSEIMSCENINQTGVCTSCCDDNRLCNAASSVQHQWFVMATSTILSFGVIMLLPIRQR
ncbi:uncharacterized protein LOC144433760 [Glandiceps talaboti]